MTEWFCMLDCLNRQFTVRSILQRMNRLSNPLSNRCLHMSFETVYKMWVQHRGNQSGLQTYVISLMNVNCLPTCFYEPCDKRSVLFTKNLHWNDAKPFCTIVGKVGVFKCSHNSNPLHLLHINFSPRFRFTNKKEKRCRVWQVQKAIVLLTTSVE
jgi:hypothetical protein